jgi:hypothetical protein
MLVRKIGKGLGSTIRVEIGGVGVDASVGKLIIIGVIYMLSDKGWTSLAYCLSRYQQPG